MTREEILATYEVQSGRIATPGKFEGESIYVPYFWDMGMNGLADIDDGKVYKFRVDAEDRKQFPAELASRRWITLIEREDGFVVEL